MKHPRRLAPLLAAAILLAACPAAWPQSRAAADPRRARINQEAYYRFTRSMLAERGGDLEGAIRWLRDALRYDPSALTLRTELAVLYLKKNDFAGTIRAAEDVLALSPDHGPTLLLLAAAYQGLGNFAKAEEYYRKVLALDPDKPEASIALGNLLAEAKRPAEIGRAHV